MENIQKHASPNTKKLLLGNKIDMKGKKVSIDRCTAKGSLYLYSISRSLSVKNWNS